MEDIRKYAVDLLVKMKQLSPNPQDQDDEYIERIKKSGCYLEHEQLQNCYFDKNKDWRLCKQEMMKFKTCFKKHTQEQI